ncbi:MAG TPA: hypothetical protein P5555_04940 [Candidatus Paceibacterota bacterium]|nr:hypothetical protein [Verrucomicrobiota bacterium]HOX00775.1 hypothetical protein [Verrucomicrobiota bacterium]HRZ44517.1 hypothetical protein [Candidatus Paceibacterota bacterium]HRZ91776.1 hypothetical protein [Candidatus Paceibacterota bacterium]
MRTRSRQLNWFCASALGQSARARRGLAAVVGLSILLSALAPARVQSGADVFEEVAVYRRFFRPIEESPLLRIRTSRPVLVHTLLYDHQGRLAAACPPTPLGSKHELNLEGLPAVARGMFWFCLVAQDETGARVGLFPAQPGGGQTLSIAEAQKDARQKKIRYLLPKAAQVRIRAGFVEGPYLAPILAWTPQPAGWQEVAWDGSCQNGQFQNLYQHPRGQVIVSAVALPDNILVATIPWPSPPAVQSLAEDRLAPSLADLKSPPWPLAPATPSAMPVADDFPIDLAVEPNPRDRTVTIRANCRPEDRARLLNQRFEIMLFLDAMFVMEDERGLLPFNYRMSTRGIPPGRHALTVNVIDRYGGLGTASQTVDLAPEGGNP